MKLIKMQPDRVQIKSNDKDFEKCHLNDLIKISDGVIDLVTMVVSLTDTDSELPIADDMFLEQIGIPSVKNIECSIIGSIGNGKFTNSIDKYPTTDVTAEIMTDKEFEEMLTKENGSSFKLGNYASYDCSAMIDGNEKDLIKRLLTEVYPDGNFSMVCDSFDYWNIVDHILPELKTEILNRKGTLFVRGDSGDPINIVTQTVFHLPYRSW